jgi:hypothetical protein
MNESDVAEVDRGAVVKERTADLPRWSPPAIDIDLGQPVVVRIHRARLDLVAGEKAGRERVHKLLDQTRADFSNSPEWLEVVRLRSRLQESEQRLATAQQALDSAQGEHQAAAAAGLNDAAKLWKKVIQARDELAGAESALAGIRTALAAAERAATAALAAAITSARDSERAAIQARRGELHGELLDAVRPLLQQLVSLDSAASSLRILTETRPTLPSA